MNMMRTPLDASCFKHARSSVTNEFIMVLRGFIRIYELICKKGGRVINNEVKIRDRIFKYLQDVKITNAIVPFMFYRVNKEVDENKGRLDLKIERLMPYSNPKDYFSIECKRLDGNILSGKSGLNAKYVKEGINRYKQGKYTSYNGVNGMFGFIVANIDIDENVKYINAFLRKKERLSKVCIDDYFDESFMSAHGTKDRRKLVLYHLMFDFHKYIQR